MATPHAERIYHITSLANLPAILAMGRLSCVNDLRAQASEYKSIAYDHIQDRRAGTLVPCGPGGCLHDYVPFSFAPRSPMLYTISRGNVAGADQRDVVHLVSRVDAMVRTGRLHVFTDGHAIMALTDFYDNTRDLDKINWNVMRSQYWNDTWDNPDRKRQRQAEFLVYRFVPWSAIEEIGVMSDTIRTQVLELLPNTPDQPPATVRRDWYY